jgi:hypothetical protein
VKKYYENYFISIINVLDLKYFFESIKLKHWKSLNLSATIAPPYTVQTLMGLAGPIVHFWNLVAKRNHFKYSMAILPTADEMVKMVRFTRNGACFSIMFFYSSMMSKSCSQTTKWESGYYSEVCSMMNVIFVIEK